MVEIDDLCAVRKSNEARKLQLPWIGPYKVKAKLGPKSYALALPGNLKVTNHFDVTRLRRYIPPIFKLNDLEYFKPDATIDEQGEEVYEILKFVKYRMNGKRAEVKVRWVGHDAGEDSWEPVDAMPQEMWREYAERHGHAI